MVRATEESEKQVRILEGVELLGMTDDEVSEDLEGGSLGKDTAVSDVS